MQCTISSAAQIAPHSDVATSPDFVCCLARLRDDPQRTILMLPTPTLPSARLLHILRYYFDHYGLAIEVVIEGESLHLLAATPPLLVDRLLRIPRSHYQDGTLAQVFADRRGLLKRLRAAGGWLHILPRIPHWGVVVDQLAFLTVLERGVIVPPSGYDALHDLQPPDTAPQRARRPEDNPNFVDPWLGKRSEWCGVSTAVRREV